MDEYKPDPEMMLETQDVLMKDWRVARVSENAENLNRRLLLEALEERILYLLKNNMAKLQTSMYLLDISERRFSDAMGRATMEGRARAIAEVVYDRESQKIETRRKYSGSVYRRLDEDPGPGPLLGE